MLLVIDIGNTLEDLDKIVPNPTCHCQVLPVVVYQLHLVRATQKQAYADIIDYTLQ